MGRLFEGASIFRSRYWQGDAISSGQGFEFISEAWGEAIPIDLGEAGFVVGALGPVFGLSPNEGFFTPVGANSIVTPLTRAGLIVTGAGTTGSSFEQASKIVGRHEWPGSRPTLLLFNQERTLESVRVLVEDRLPKESLSNTPFVRIRDAIGGDAEVISVTIEMVDSEPDERIAQLLPWVPDLDKSSSGQWVSASFADNLTVQNFKINRARG